MLETKSSTFNALFSKPIFSKRIQKYFIFKTSNKKLWERFSEHSLLVEMLGMSKLLSKQYLNSHISNQLKTKTDEGSWY